MGAIQVPFYSRNWPTNFISIESYAQVLYSIEIIPRRIYNFSLRPRRPDRAHTRPSLAESLASRRFPSPVGKERATPALFSSSRAACISAACITMYHSSIIHNSYTISITHRKKWSRCHHVAWPNEAQQPHHPWWSLIILDVVVGFPLAAPSACHWRWGSFHVQCFGTTFAQLRGGSHWSSYNLRLSWHLMENTGHGIKLVKHVANGKQWKDHLDLPSGCLCQFAMENHHAINR